MCTTRSYDQRICGSRDLPVHRDHPSLNLDITFLISAIPEHFIFLFHFPWAGSSYVGTFLWPSVLSFGFTNTWMGSFAIFCLPSLVYGSFALLCCCIGVSLCVYNIAWIFLFFKSECFTKDNIRFCLKYRFVQRTFVCPLTNMPPLWYNDRVGSLSAALSNRIAPGITRCGSVFDGGAESDPT